MEPCVKKKVIKRTGWRAEETEDIVAEETKIILSVNKKEVMRLYCSPTMLREFVVGFLLTEGIVRGHFCADSIVVQNGEDGVIHIDIPFDGEVSAEGLVRTTGCIGGMTYATKEFRQTSACFSIGADAVRSLYREFNQSAPLFKKTGCMHSAAISDGRSIFIVAEDIGRHNAVDKVIGYCVIHNIGLEDKIMLVSGRLSSEIAAKCARWGIPVLMSRTSPTSHAIEIAEKAKITLIGFVRGERFTIYANAQRVL